MKQRDINQCDSNSYNQMQRKITHKQKIENPCLCAILQFFCRQSPQTRNDRQTALWAYGNRNRFLRLFYYKIGGEEGIRTLVGLRPNGFQDRLVMTASIPLLQAISLYHKKIFLSTPFCDFVSLHLYFLSPIFLFFDLQRIYTRKTSVW